MTELNELPPARLPFPVTRALSAPIEARAADGGMPTMSGHFSTFNDWYEVDSYIEGHFLERIAPGAFRKTISESRSSMKVLYDHGGDPQIGNKILGPIDSRSFIIVGVSQRPLTPVVIVMSTTSAIRKRIGA